MKLLSCQVSTHLINEGKIVPPYYDIMFNRLKSQGYAKPYHFWEIPNWAAIIAKNFPNSDFYIVTNKQTTIQFLNKLDYTHICFSVMDANKEIIKNIIEDYHGKATFILGGYINFSYFKDCPNVKVFDTITQFIKSENVSFINGYDYRHFRETTTIPRLTLSTGCLHHCSFCTEGNGRIEETDITVAKEQIDAYRDLNFSLVYLNDKTFGQAKNHTQLPMLRKYIEKINPAFRGFIIQTNDTQFLQLSDNYLIDAGIQFVELGIETYNDSILRKYHKPSNIKIIDCATARFYNLACKFIPNLIIGFPEETYDTYGATLKYLNDNASVISHLNICNLAVYANTDLANLYNNLSTSDQDEYVLDKSFHTDPGPHHWFSDEVFKLGIKLLPEDN